MYIYIYIYIYIYTIIHIHVDMNSWEFSEGASSAWIWFLIIYTYIYIYIYICIYVYTCIYIYIYIHIYIYNNPYPIWFFALRGSSSSQRCCRLCCKCCWHICVCMYIYINIYLHTCIYMYIYIYVCLLFQAKPLSRRPCVAVCCSVLQCVAVCCSVVQCAAVCCSVVQCVAVCCSWACGGGDGEGRQSGCRGHFTYFVFNDVFLFLTMSFFFTAEKKAGAAVKAAGSGCQILFACSLLMTFFPFRQNSWGSGGCGGKGAQSGAIWVPRTFYLFRFWWRFFCFDHVLFFFWTAEKKAARRYAAESKIVRRIYTYDSALHSLRRRVLGTKIVRLGGKGAQSWCRGLFASSLLVTLFLFVNVFPFFRQNGWGSGGCSGEGAESDCRRLFAGRLWVGLLDYYHTRYFPGVADGARAWWWRTSCGSRPPEW